MNKKGNYTWPVIAIVVVIVALIVAAAGFDTVDANHLGVKVKLGRIIGTMEPGLEWTGLMTQVYQYDLRIRKAKVNMMDDASSATDKDGQAVYGSVSVNYRLKKSKDVVQNLYSGVGPDNVLADRLNLVPIIKEGFKQSTVKYEAIEILQNRQKVKEQAQENIKRNFPSDYFEIVDIVVEDIDFSPEFKKAIEEKKTATQQKLKEQEQVQVVMYQQQQEIEKYKAEAEKMRLQRQEVTALLNEQKMIEKWNGELPQYLIITPDSQGMLLNLAQGKGISQTKTPSTPVGGGTP